MVTHGSQRVKGEEGQEVVVGGKGGREERETLRTGL